MIPAYALNIYSSQALIPARVKSFHTFPEKNVSNPLNPLLFAQIKQQQLVLNIAMKLYFFS